MCKLKFAALIATLTAAALSISGVAVASVRPPASEHGPASLEDPQVVRITVTDDGIDEKQLQVKLEQGKPVELKFEFKQTYFDGHEFELSGYGIKSERLSQSHKEVSLKFVPTQLGTLAFLCTSQCEIHHLLQDRKLTIVAPGAGGDGGQATEQPTSLTLASVQQTSAGEPVTLLATLRDAKGQPISGAQVSFFVATDLFPDMPMLVGTTATDPSGGAKLVYTPRTNGPLNVQAKFEGGGIYKTADATYSMQVSNAKPAYREEPRGLSIGRWAPQGLVLVFLAVWSVYAIVVFQIFRIARSREGKA